MPLIYVSTRACQAVTGEFGYGKTYEDCYTYPVGADIFVIELSIQKILLR